MGGKRMPSVEKFAMAGLWAAVGALAIIVIARGKSDRTGVKSPANPGGSTQSRDLSEQKPPDAPIVYRNPAEFPVVSRKRRSNVRSKRNKQ